MFFAPQHSAARSDSNEQTRGENFGGLKGNRLSSVSTVAFELSSIGLRTPERLRHKGCSGIDGLVLSVHSFQVSIPKNEPRKPPALVRRSYALRVLPGVPTCG